MNQQEQARIQVLNPGMRRCGFRHGLRLFFRCSRTVSWDKDSTKPSSTFFPASSRQMLQRREQPRLAFLPEPEALARNVQHVAVMQHPGPSGWEDCRTGKGNGYSGRGAYIWIFNPFTTCTLGWLIAGYSIMPSRQ